MPATTRKQDSDDMESASHSLRYLLRYFKRYRRQLLLMALTLLVASMMQMNEGL